MGSERDERERETPRSRRGPGGKTSPERASPATRSKYRNERHAKVYYSFYRPVYNLGSTGIQLIKHTHASTNRWSWFG